MAVSVRVRYAPSPTGEPHVGNIRTALFNWLFAKHHGGAFILRIEDTDQKRQTSGALSSIFDSLNWLGLLWDEGPSSSGSEQVGKFGPYIQSQRLNIYRKFANDLLTGEVAYQCYCSPNRLAEMRTDQQKQTSSPKGYDRRCLGLTRPERSQLENDGTPYVLRFRVPDHGTTSVQDQIRGSVEWSNNSLDDFVLLKSDGFPTYHLANVVDDHLMAISHVLRAEEWLPSTPRHLLLYNALGWQAPNFAHLPMILGPDRSKLSKRHGATSLMEYQQQGFLEEAMINFLALLGWSLDDQTDIISVNSLIKNFSLDRINKSGAIFNKEKLEWMNGVYIRSLSHVDLASKLNPFFQSDRSEPGILEEGVKPPTRHHLLKIVPLIQDRIRTLVDARHLFSYLFQSTVIYDPDLLVQKGMERSGTVKVLREVKNRLLPVTSWKAEVLEALLRNLCNDVGIKPAQLFGTIRVSMTGKTATPPLFQTMEALGKTMSIHRVTRSINELKTKL